VLSSVDARQKTRTFTYDILNRPLTTRIPKDAAAGEYIVTPGPKYDANDNMITLTAANRAVTTAAYDENDQLVALTAPRESAGEPAKTSTLRYDPVGNLLAETRPKGTLTRDDPDDFVTRYTYDELNRRLTVIDPLGERSTAAYDSVGNLVTEVDAKKSRTPDPNDYATKYEYDLNHRVTAVIDAAGHRASVGYDRDGNVVETTDQEGNTSLTRLDGRGMVVETRVPHARDGGDIRYFTSRYEYDQVGNPTRTTLPRGTETADPNDFVQTVVYDELNRIREKHLPFAADDETVDAPDKIFYGYDQVGQLTEVSAPPSEGQSVRNVTRQTYYDNGWLRSSVDPFGIRTNYDYNTVGAQTSRTFLSAGGGSSRTMSWEYQLNGKLKSRSDDGVPVGQHVVLVDNSDASHTEVTGGWRVVDGNGADHEGYDYRVATATEGSFTWKADIPASGDYDVAVRFPRGAATNARYTVEHNGGSTSRTVDQTQDAGEWVSLGRFAFTEDNLRNITLAGDADNPVVADAVRLVRDNSGDVDTEKKTFQHRYDVNDNLVSITDASSGARTDEYTIGYDALDRATSIEERKDGALRNTTRYDYDPNGNIEQWRHDDQTASFAYDARDLLERITNRATGEGAEDRVTTFGYTARSHVRQQVKPNGNTVDFEYHLDGLLRHQVEKKSGGTVVNEHTLEYNANSHKTRDTARRQNADDHSAFLDDVFSYEYDPRDRVRKVTKSGSDGDEKSTETYRHDANNNIIEQRIKDDTTTFRYDRNRLASSAVDGTTFVYGYDPFGRLSRISTGGEQTERYVYDGFDRTAEYRQGTGAATNTTRYAYDPLDRTVSRTAKAGGDDARTTTLDYLGLTQQVLTERVDGELRKSYQYSAFGELLGQLSVPEDGEREQSYHGYNAHADVESLTDEDGNNSATYGYTAYGGDDTDSFTGVDKPDAGDPDAEPENVYRFNTARWDSASGNYDMGLRDYSPGENRFLSLDLYNGALSDLSLSMNPFTMNRYSFGGGNPISMVDLTGHWPSWSDIGHAALDVVGLVPVVGEVADVANGIWYTAEGNYVDAALSFTSAIPLAGYGATAVKAGKYGKAGVDAVQAGAKGADEVAAGAKGAPPAKTGGDAPPAPPAKGGGDTPPAGNAPAGGNAPVGPAKPAPPPQAPPAPPPAPKPPGCPNSFVPGTGVVLADGTSKPIEDVQVGDQVLATDPVTGLTESRPVVALIVGEGTKNLVEVTVDTDGARGDATGTVIATADHPFWLDTAKRWADADELATGGWLRTDDRDLVRVLSVRVWSQQQRVHNLTVDGLHTYYALADDTPVLVHNCGGSVGGHKAACACATGGTPVGPRNAHLAGGTHKSGVPFDAQGFPDFSAWRHPNVPDVRIQLSGRRGTDESRANKAANLSSTPSGYTWHHHQNCGKMQLVERPIHRATGHTGGFSIC
jgi:RHS repeat-associated protein